MVPSSIQPSRLAGIIAFLQDAEKLKDTLRSGSTSSGRAESTAEHSWRLCLMAMLFNRELDNVDMLKLLKMCVIHDLGEAISGDTPATVQQAGDGRSHRERGDLAALCAPLPGDLKVEILHLFDEYKAAETPEAILAKGFDKLETILQHAIGANGPGFDYVFNLAYGADQTARHAILRQIRTVADRLTLARVATEAG